MKSQKEWVDIIATVGYDEKRFNQKLFEETVADKFVAVRLNKEGKPVLIWTEKYVCSILFEAFENQSPFLVFLRNPN